MRKLAEYYEQLGLEPSASLGDVRGAYRQLLQVWHPDRFSHNADLQRRAEEETKRINEAYRILCNQLEKTRVAE